MKKLFVFVIVLNLISCTKKNPEQSYYYLSIDDALDIGYPYGSIVYKSSKENSYENVIIYSDIIQYVSDSRYILIQQKPNRKLIEKKIRDDLTFWSVSYAATKKDSVFNIFDDMVSIKDISRLQTGLKINDLKSVTDSIFNNNKSLQKIFRNNLNYYLIDKMDGSLNGPLSRKELLKIKDRKAVALNFD